jgi:hypothetical protein
MGGNMVSSRGYAIMGIKAMDSVLRPYFKCQQTRLVDRLASS